MWVFNIIPDFPPLEGTVLLLVNVYPQINWNVSVTFSIKFPHLVESFWNSTDTLVLSLTLIVCGSQCWGCSGEAERQSADHGLPGGERLQRANPGSEERGPGHVHACPYFLHQWCGELCWWGTSLLLLLPLLASVQLIQAAIITAQDLVTAADTAAVVQPLLLLMMNAVHLCSIAVTYTVTSITNIVPTYLGTSITTTVIMSDQVFILCKAAL